ncbi:hypothetical protein [Brevibacillus agri]|uniref:Uncharacterized protein n=1 Tax=Brevibacillus agri TaxID=51101 RepID=A0A3M8AH84_9BACL|nr:hypothetical protein [Brevibacillus agri]QAV12811.1 hypothetical protein BA6348_08540 [Brevibacillus agri]RNB50574.1 hypothetical protein EB820_21460 [Brevibacillus agri]
MQSRVRASVSYGSHGRSVPSESGETLAALQSRVRASVSYGSHGRPVPSKSARCLLRLRL